VLAFCAPRKSVGKLKTLIEKVHSIGRPPSCQRVATFLLRGQRLTTHDIGEPAHYFCGNKDA
jgi:hypothetical protein